MHTRVRFNIIIALYKASFAQYIPNRTPVWALYQQVMLQK